VPWSLDGVLPCARRLELEAALNGLASAGDAPALAAQLRGYLLDAAGRDLGGLLATRLVSAFNDRLATRVIELTARRHRLPDVAWCWLAFGSEGRHEQTFVSDQDNGLVFGAVDQREAIALRELFVPFARDVNQRLAECGFPLCSGDIMAGNPAWCLSLDEWRERFIDWVRRPDPQALLNASIFFDLRPLCGDAGLGENLRTLLLALTSDSPAFLHLMAANALQAPAPLNFRGDIVTDDEAGHRVDLKKFGSRIFVDAARIFALAAGARSVNTSARLRDAGPAAGLAAGDIEAADAAFGQLLRIRIACQRRWPEVADHGVPLAELDEFERAVLRETLRQARRLQQRLKVNYAL
jgi:CBS domain-containing protein